VALPYSPPQGFSPAEVSAAAIPDYSALSLEELDAFSNTFSIFRDVDACKDRSSEATIIEYCGAPEEFFKHCESHPI
jgi:hypothetical protein